MDEQLTCAGQLVIGNVFKEFDEDDQGKQVEEYLQKYGH